MKVVKDDIKTMNNINIEDNEKNSKDLVDRMNDKNTVGGMKRLVSLTRMT